MRRGFKKYLSTAVTPWNGATGSAPAFSGCAMPYISKDESGHILALHREAGDEAREFLAPNHPEVLAFLAEGDGSEGTASAGDFLELDLGVIRVIDDVVDTLIRKNLLMLTDLPPAAREKILKRRRMREELTSGGILVNDLKLF